uniref:Type 2 C1q domain-containing protein 8 n=1 Tax=Littorina littorea TaxID=31216 RepID=A0A411DEM3_LITLI|nr:type 2 C1q domain-containing protein 8 [Littorina littorea]
MKSAVIFSLVCVLLIKGRVVTRSHDTLPLRAVVQELTKQVSANRAEILALKARQQKSETNIAFHAEFSSDPVQLGPLQRLVLDKVVVNFGSGYDATSGHFEAPVSGTYMFVVNFMGDINTYNYVKLILERSVVDYSISHGDGTTWDHAGETIILHLTAGQNVWLQRGNEQAVTKTLRGHHWTTFSGFLIKPDLE